MLVINLIQSRVSVLGLMKPILQDSPTALSAELSRSESASGLWLPSVFFIMIQTALGYIFTKWFPDCYYESWSYKTVETQEALFRTTHTLTYDYMKAWSFNTQLALVMFLYYLLKYCTWVQFSSGGIPCSVTLYLSSTTFTVFDNLSYWFLCRFSLIIQDFNS